MSAYRWGIYPCVFGDGLVAVLPDGRQALLAPYTFPGRGADCYSLMVDRACVARVPGSIDDARAAAEAVLARLFPGAEGGAACSPI